MPLAATTVLGIAGIVLSLPAWFYFLRGAVRLYRLIASGKPDPGHIPRINRPVRRLITLIKETVFHTELMRKPVVAVAHWCVMVGFLIGSSVWFEAYIQTFNPAGGWPIISDWPLYHLADEVLALVTVLGILVLIFIRLVTGNNNRIDRFYGSNARAAHFVEGVVLLEGIGMMLVKAGKIATFDVHPHVWTDFLTMQLAKILPANPVLVSIFALIKLLTGMVWLLVVGNQLHWGVAWHRFLAFFKIFLQRNPDGAPALGKLPTIDLDETVGVGTAQDVPWTMLLDAATCTECGRCQEQCPAWNTNKPLSPKKFITDVRDAALDNASTMYDGVDVLKLVGTAVTGDELWSCTNCGACVEQCPVDIEHIDHVANLRRFQVLAESDFPSELTGMFKNLEAKGNPWGRNDSERVTWIDEARRDGLTVPVFGEDITSFADTEYLFWVGCAGTFDDEGKKTTRAIVELLETAGVKYCVLSKGETCTGDPARRAGNEFLFQMLAEENVTTLNGVFDGVPAGQRKIITSCAHCFNTLRNEYPDFDGHFDVFHHTQLLNRLVRDGLLKPVPRPASARKPITYHDPCFLGRHNKIFDPPRELLSATGMELREMDRNRNEGFCCGAGGARMFMEEKLGTRINENRTAEALSTGAEEIAVGCPFCNTMLTSGVKALSDAPASEQPIVRDVAQMLRDSVMVDGELPSPREPQFLEPPKRNAVAKKPGEEKKAEPKKAETPSSTVVSAPGVPSAGVPKAGGVPPKPGISGAPGVPSAPNSANIPQAPSAPGVSNTQPPPAPPAAPKPPTPTAGIPAAPGAPGTPNVPKAPGTPTTTVPKPPGAPASPAAKPPSAPPKPPSAPKIPQPPSGSGVPTPPAPGVPQPLKPPQPPAPPKPAEDGEEKTDT